MLLFGVGALFWVYAVMGGDVMKPEVYGEFATSYPAEMWAGGIMGGTALIICGLIRPICNWQVAVGGAICCLNYIALTYSAVFTGGEFVIGVFCGVFFLSWHVWLTLEGIFTYGRD